MSSTTTRRVRAAGPAPRGEVRRPVVRAAEAGGTGTAGAGLRRLPRLITLAVKHRRTTTSSLATSVLLTGTLAVLAWFFLAGRLDVAAAAAAALAIQQLGTRLLGSAIYRAAFYRAAPFVVLDEPTAALDPRAEHDVFERLRSLAAGRTVLFVSHRLATVRTADRILVLRDGRLIEEGHHDELMARRGYYAELFTLQAAAYTG